MLSAAIVNFFSPLFHSEMTTVSMHKWMMIFCGRTACYVFFVKSVKETELKNSKKGFRKLLWRYLVILKCNIWGLSPVEAITYILLTEKKVCEERFETKLQRNLSTYNRKDMNIWDELSSYWDYNNFKIAACLVFTIWFLYKWLKRPPNFPPGPNGLPLVGKAHKMFDRPEIQLMVSTWKLFENIIAILTNVLD